MDKEKIQLAVRQILEAIGEDPDRQGLLDTPKRVANMYEEVFQDFLKTPLFTVKRFLRNNTKKWYL